MQRPIVLDEWQEEILKHRGNVLLCTGRQVGKTTIFARKAGQRMINQPGCRIIVVSLTEDQAKLIIVMILDYLETKKGIISQGKNRPTQNKIVLRNGSSVIARPVGTTGDAVRGFTGDVLIIDEASRMPELVWVAGLPTLLTTGGEIWICSTPHGKEGQFYEFFLNKEGMFKVFHISSEKVIHERPISAGWTEEQRTKAIKFLEGQKAALSELRYGQEYLGLFLEDLKRYFPDSLIEKCCTLKRRSAINKAGEYYLGVDIARMGDDETTYEILDKINDETIEQVENLVATKQLTTQTEQRIIDLDRQYNFQKIFIDAGSGSLGVGIFDHLLNNDQTKRKVEAINNRARVLDKDKKKTAKILKEDLYDNLRSLMEKGVIHLLDDPNIQLSLRSIQYEFITAPNRQTRMHISGDYSHITEGLIRAAWCSKDKSLSIWVKSIRI